MEDGKTEKRRGVKQIRLIIAGDVQGVGFRAWVLTIAKELQLVGWVKNREDGTVEVVAQGQNDALEPFIRKCRRGPPLAVVKNVTTQWQQSPEAFLSFQVIY